MASDITTEKPNLELDEFFEVKEDAFLKLISCFCPVHNVLYFVKGFLSHAFPLKEFVIKAIPKNGLCKGYSKRERVKASSLVYNTDCQTKGEA